MSDRKKHWGRILLQLAGLALLVYVFSLVDWRDSVQLVDGTVLRGEIVGELPARWDDGTELRFAAVT